LTSDRPLTATVFGERGAVALMFLFSSKYRTELSGGATDGNQGAAQEQPIAEAGNITLSAEEVADAGAGMFVTKNRRGGIALALGGGAAKGWAHIGILRAFEEAQIPIAMVAGTSIGALVGGCYVAGKLDDLEEFARSLTLSGLLRYMDFSLGKSGLISGMRLANRMTEHLGDISIEELATRFVSVCTDIRTGHEIWLHDGPLVHAIRASYALPGVFAPVIHNGRHLVDGAIVNPVPVSVCRAYEPEIVIGVDLNSEAFGRGTVIRASHYDADDQAAVRSIASANSAGGTLWRNIFSAHEKPPATGADSNIRIRTLNDPRINPKNRLGIMGVMMEAFSIIQDRIARARLAGDPPDYIIRPKLYSVGLADFHKAAESIELGYREAKKQIMEMTDCGELKAP
jgi:NTE family protein